MPSPRANLADMAGRKPSPIAPDLQVALRHVGAQLTSGLRVADAFAQVPALLDRIDPGSLAEAEADIVREAGLDRRQAEPSFMTRLTGRALEYRDQLRETKDLEKLFLFHRDGRLREAALHKFEGPVSSPFIFVALAWRLNDWVPEVRRAAAACAGRCFPQTSPAIAAKAALVLLLRRSTWGRWTDEHRLIDNELSRPDVAAELVTLVIRRATGPNATVLREALRTPWLDFSLPRIASEAVQPATRATAYQALIAGQASWPYGWRWRWVDKSIGRKRAETVFANRALTIDVPLEATIAQALDDRSGTVRSVAMSGVIRHHDRFPDAKIIARRFLADKARGVRERAAFILRASQ